MPAFLALALAAAQPASTCPMTPAALGGALAGWSHGRAMAAAAQAPASAAATLQPGVRADVTLLPSAQVTRLVPATKPSAPGNYGGTLNLVAAHAGTHRIALSGAAWIDLVGADGKALVSTAHQRGPECSGIRKIVDFALQPGRYTVQIDGSATPVIGVLLIAA